MRINEIKEHKKAGSTYDRSNIIAKFLTGFNKKN